MSHDFKVTDLVTHTAYDNDDNVIFLVLNVFYDRLECVSVKENNYFGFLERCAFVIDSFGGVRKIKP